MTRERIKQLLETRVCRHTDREHPAVFEDADVDCVIVCFECAVDECVSSFNYGAESLARRLAARIDEVLPGTLVEKP